MPKYSLTSAQRVERYKRKIEEIEKREQVKRSRRRIIYSDSDESDVVDQDDTLLNDLNMEDQVQEDQVQEDQVQEDQVQEDDVVINSSPERQDKNDDQGQSNESAAENPPIDTVASPSTAVAAPPSSEVTPAAEPSLDPALLDALGEATSDNPEFGESIHDSLANLWLPLLKKELTKESKEKLLKEYLVPSNCKLLQAPKLNPEISAAVSEVVRGRDKKYVVVQQQLGQGVAAVNRAMDVMLKSDNKVEALKYLSDSCRILSDMHNFFTKDRKKMITPSLDKNFLHVIQDSERDEFLFGSSLSEKIKASKAIEKQGQQIKKTLSLMKTNTQSTTNARPSTSQGNWSGPPRFSSNRGGRGGGRSRPYQAPSTRRAYSNVSTAKSSTQTKPRAPTHQ